MNDRVRDEMLDSFDEELELELECVPVDPVLELELDDALELEDELELEDALDVECPVVPLELALEVLVPVLELVAVEADAEPVLEPALVEPAGELPPQAATVNRPTTPHPRTPDRSRFIGHPYHWRSRAPRRGAPLHGKFTSSARTGRRTTPSPAASRAAPARPRG